MIDKGSSLTLPISNPLTFADIGWRTRTARVHPPKEFVPAAAVARLTKELFEDESVISTILSNMIVDHTSGGDEQRQLAEHHLSVRNDFDGLSQYSFIDPVAG